MADESSCSTVDQQTVIQMMDKLENKLEIVEDEESELESEDSLMDDDFHDAIDNLEIKSSDDPWPEDKSNETIPQNSDNLKTPEKCSAEESKNVDNCDKDNSNTESNKQSSIPTDTDNPSGADGCDEAVKEALQDSEQDSETEEDEDGLKELKLLEETLSEQEKEERKEKAQELKAHGNELFKDTQINEAKEEYTKALKLCPLCFKKERSVMYSNRAACHMRLENTDTAISDCSKAIELNPRYTKCVLRRAELYDKTDKLDEALKDFEKVIELEPTNQTVRIACMQLPERIKERNEKMKEEMLGKLKDLGNMILKPFGLSTNNFNLQQDPNSGGYSVSFNNNGK
ncbi:tetratricopeptide repeat protein 1-like [Tubulanus polymorphus]|uniref:tetratricopeptide repeat protein 1-like n=1 Tax=Tubulanus polymorphus TaxID=672921 RepID=UPI003DA32441